MAVVPKMKPDEMRIPDNLVEAAARFTNRVTCPNCEGVGGWGGEHAPAVIDCPRCDGRGWLPRKTDAQNIQEASQSMPPTYAVLLGILVSHPDFVGIHRAWHWNEERKDYEAFVVSLRPKNLWNYHTQPKPTIVEAILEALHYLESPVDPKTNVT